jgi:hypothetical protein
MTHPASKVRLALDHNFPAPVLKVEELIQMHRLRPRELRRAPP